MAVYRVYNLLIESTLPLPAQQPGENQQPEWTFRLSRASGDAHPDCAWLDDRVGADGTPWPAIGRSGARYVVRFPATADFAIDLAARDIHCAADPDIPLHTIRHLLLDQVLPRIIGHLSGPVLHASAVVIDGRAVAFLGLSGHGKSTLGASLCQQGFPLVADDGLVLEVQGEQIMAHPSYPALRLWDDSMALLAETGVRSGQVAHYMSKHLIDPDGHVLQFCAVPVPLHRAYLLANPDETAADSPIRFERMGPRDAIIEAFKASFTLDITDRGRLRHDLEHLAHIVERIPFVRLVYPRDLAMLPAVHRAILAHVATS